jgi:uncharacterized protein (TIGR02300 family)
MCTSCGIRFYDLTKTPIICPKCSAEVEPDVVYRSRRQLKTEGLVSKPGIVIAEDAVFDPDLEVAGLIEVEDDVVVDDVDEENLMEDTSELGEDDDDMAEVRDHLDEDIEGEI